MEKQHLTALIEHDASGKMVAVASDETLDRQGESIPIETWDLKNFKQNPVLQAGHVYMPQATIGAAKNVRVEGKKLLFEPVFHDITQLAREIGQMFREGFLKTFSVGFIRHTDEKTGEISNELLEVSAVPVPANPKARIIQLAAEAPESPEAQVAIKSWVIEHAELDTAKGVIPYSKRPLASIDAAWDGPVEISKAEVSDLKIMCTWFDSDNAEIKGAYKLPHHKAQGDHATVFRGVTAAMAALLGARGGVDMPQGDRRGAYNHLVKHYADFDREAPEFRSYEPEEILFIGEGGAPKQATEVQTVIMAKSMFPTMSEAKKWCADHDFRTDKVDETEDSFRFRQFDPGRCQEGSFRTIEIMKGVKAVICRPEKGVGSCQDLISLPAAFLPLEAAPGPSRSSMAGGTRGKGRDPREGQKRDGVNRVTVRALQLSVGYINEALRHLKK